MMTKRKPIKVNEAGMILIPVMILLVIGSIIIAALSSYMITGLKSNSVFKEKTDALYAADAGVEDAIWKIKYGIVTLNNPVAYHPYDYGTVWSYPISEQINLQNVTVSIKNVWIPQNIPVPTDPAYASNLITTGKLIVTGNVSGASTYQVKISYYKGGTDAPLEIQTLGIWLPPGYTYVTDSSNLEADDTKSYYPLSVDLIPHSGGQAVIWTFNPGTLFAGSGAAPLQDPFPSVDPTDVPMTSTISFDFDSQQPGGTPNAISWVTTTGVTDIPFAWDADTLIYHVNSTAGATQAEAYIAKNELRQLQSSIAGDYYATGNSALSDTDGDRCREMPRDPSSAAVTQTNIPADADVAAAYIYWTGWKNDNSVTVVPPLSPDPCDDFTNWAAGSAWDTTTSPGMFTGYAYGKASPGRDISLNNSLPLSSYGSTGTLTVSWDQSVYSGNIWNTMTPALGNVTTGSALVYCGGDYIYALQGGITTFWRYSISGNSWSMMAATPAATGAGAALVYCGGDYIYTFRGNSTTTFWRYSISGNSWSTMTAAPASIGAGGALAYSSGDYIYALRGGTQTSFYRYSISGDSWTTRTAAPNTIAAGGALVHGSGDYLYAFRGGTQSTFYRYSISGNSWTTRRAAPASIGAGGALAYSSGDYIYALRGGTQTAFYCYSISGNSWTTMAAAPNTVAAGGALVQSGGNYFYAFRGNSTTTFWRYDTAKVYSASDGLNLSYSLDGGSTWSSNINAFIGPGTPTSPFIYPIPGLQNFTTTNFKIKLSLVGFDNPAQYYYIDNIKIAVMTADTSVVFKIDDGTGAKQVYFDEGGQPQQGTQELTASKTQLVQNFSGTTPHGYSYSSFRDVTDLVREYSQAPTAPDTNYPGYATYWVGGIYADTRGTSGQEDEWAYASWSLVIIYTSPQTQGHQLYLYDRFTYSNHDTTNGVNVDFDHDGQPGGTISGFIVPQPIVGEVNAGKITTFVGEGDVWYPGDYLAVNGTRLWDGTNTDNNSKNNPNNSFNSTSMGLGAYDGIDIDTFGIDPPNGQYVTWASNILHQGDTSAQVDLVTHQDVWNLVYIIISFRSETSTGGSLTYLIKN